MLPLSSWLLCCDGPAKKTINCMSRRALVTVQAIQGAMRQTLKAPPHLSCLKSQLYLKSSPQRETCNLKALSVFIPNKQQLLGLVFGEGQVSEKSITRNFSCWRGRSGVQYKSKQSMNVRGSLYGSNLKITLKYREPNIIILIHGSKSNKQIWNEYIMKIRFSC